MAGEEKVNDVLDMSLFDIDLLERKEEVEEPIETKQIIANVVDDESQEKVDNQEEGKDPKVEEKTTNSPADSEKVIGPLATFLKEQGFFPTLTKEIETVEELAEAFKEEVKRSEFSSLNSKQKAYLDALAYGVPEDVFAQHVEDSDLLEGITNETLENSPEICRQLIIQEAILKGDTKERAERRYQRSYDIGDSIEDAFTAREFLIQKKEEVYKEEIAYRQQEQVRAQQEYQQQLDDLKESVFNQTTVFDTFKIDDGMKRKVYENMTKIVGYSADGLPLNELMQHKLENPIEFETMLYYLYTLTNKFKDTNKFNTKAETVAAKKLREAVVNNTFISSGGSSNYIDPNEHSAPIVDV